MTIRSNRSLAIAAAFALASATAASAQVQDPLYGAAENFFTLQPGGNHAPPPEMFGGGPCSAVVPQAGAERVWWGRFAGGRIIDGARHVRMHNVTAEGCFPTQVACQRWMFMMATYNQDNPRYNDCRAGYRPGAPVRYVFSPAWAK